MKVTWVTLPKWYKTNKNKYKIVNLPKGTYRAVISAKCGYAKTYTDPVTRKK